MTRVQIQPELVYWAAQQAGLPLDVFATQISRRDADKIIEGSFSEAQIHRASQVAKIKFYELFLDEPPEQPKIPLIDFRTAQTSDPISKDFFDIYHDTQYKQEWYKDYLLREGAEPLPFIGKYRTISNHKKIALAIREKLSMEERPTSGDYNTYYSFLAQKIEDLGVLVLKNGIVGNNTRRPLNVREFRGFTICDPIAPAIFINGRDAPAAWIFTLLHELAHLLRGDSGVSDASGNSTNREEAFCNKIAAEALVPEADFATIWGNSTHRDTDDKLFEAQSFFRVSMLVVARRALDLELISRDKYLEKSRYSEAKTPRASSGGNFYASLNVRNSKTLTKTVSNLAATGALSFKEAGRLLQVPPVNVMKVYKNNNAISS